MEHVQANLLSPITLAFVLGVVATLARSDLKVPEALYSSLSIYLLLAIGLKGGAELAKTSPAEFAFPAGATLLLGLLTPVTTYLVTRRLGGFSRADAAAMAAHYGSVSVVTFIAADTFSRAVGTPGEGFLPTLVAFLEVPAIIVALLTAKLGGAGRDGAAAGAAGAPGATGAAGASWGAVLHEVLAGRSIVLLAGGLVIGALSGEKGLAPVAPFFSAGFKGALTLFLLEMGMVAARRLGDLRKAGAFLAAFALLAPVAHGALGVWLGALCGLSVGGCAVLGAMAGSASYIAAPAAVRMAIPEANPTLYLTASLGITFPFNLVVGIPLYHALAKALVG